MDEVRRVLDAACRSEQARIIGTLTRILGSLEAAEDVMQAAAERALEHWPRRGLPINPGAWLTTVARRIALDELRRRSAAERARGRLTRELDGTCTDDPYHLLGSWPDERLRLILTCCHPLLDTDSRVALTLKEVCGLSTGQIAGSFLVAEATMAQRLVRAKRRLREHLHGFEIPVPGEISDHLADVLRVIYLVFNEGYIHRGGIELTHIDLCTEAVRIALLIPGLMRTEGLDAEPEALGLAALLVLIHARRDARIDTEGLPVLLEEQDRSRWRRDEADHGLALLDQALALKRPGPYQLLAAVNAVHATADSAESTEWEEILALYDRLLLFEPTSVVALNRAVALGMARGADAGLAALEARPVADLDGYPYLHLARARFLEEAGREDEAAPALRRAHALSENEAERALITRRLAGLRNA
ncbi:MAG: RNA polymerase sigma factor [Spirochaetaceae bacterium]